MRLLCSQFFGHVNLHLISPHPKGSEWLADVSNHNCWAAADKSVSKLWKVDSSVDGDCFVNQTCAFVSFVINAVAQKHCHALG